MDIKAKIDEITEKIKANPDLKARFMKEPIPVVEELIGVDLPDDKIQPIVDTVKAKLAAGKLGGLFGKK